MGWYQKLKVNTEEGNSFSFSAFVIYLVKNQLSFFLKKKNNFYWYTSVTGNIKMIFY